MAISLQWIAIVGEGEMDVSFFCLIFILLLKFRNVGVILNSFWGETGSRVDG